MRIPNYRVMVSGWPTDALFNTGICISYCLAGNGFYWLEGKKEHVQSVLDRFNLMTFSDLEVVPTKRISEEEAV